MFKNKEKREKKEQNLINLINEDSECEFWIVEESSLQFSAFG